VIEKVQATGTVQPMLSVSVGAQVNGRVTQVLVDFNSVVKKGDVLARSTAHLQHPGERAAGQPALAARAARQAQASMASMKAQVSTARVALDRTRKLFEANLAAHSDLDTAQGTTTRWWHSSTPQRQPRQPAGIDRRAGSAAQPVPSQPELHEIYAPVDGVVVTRASIQAPPSSPASRRRCSSSSRRICTR